MENRFKKWLTAVIAVFLLAAVGVCGLIAFVDPYFHYHKPLPYLSYTLDNERYQNDGILRNFDYDAVITGSSMTENFKPSELDELFGVNSVKVPLSGGSYREVNDSLQAAFRNNDSVKMVVRGLDWNRLFNGPEDRDYEEYPDYLYDDILINDVSYTLNIEVLFVALQDIIGISAEGERKLDFDAYANWQDVFPFGKEAVDAQYARSTVEPAAEQGHVTEEEYSVIRENIEQNVIQTAVENPDVTFYLYFTPYSIAYIDYFNLTGDLERQLEAEKYIIELLLPYENIRLYSFFLQEDVITDMDNYRDVAHHSEDVNSMILQWMKEGTGLLTADNYEEYCQKERDFFLNFDYETYFADWD